MASTKTKQRRVIDHLSFIVCSQSNLWYPLKLEEIKQRELNQADAPAPYAGHVGGVLPEGGDGGGRHRLDGRAEPHRGLQPLLLHPVLVEERDAGECRPL